MKINNHFYKDRIALNVLSNSVENAKRVYDAAEGYVLIGLLSKNYDSVEQAFTSMEEYGKFIDDAVSIGLGAGDNKQAKMVEEISEFYSGVHINQVFPSVGRTRVNVKEEETWINALVSPTGEPGYVNISTGPISSSKSKRAIIPVESAIALIRDMGGNSLKYFPMNGISNGEEFRAVAEACGKEKFPMEPTGGLHLDNISQVLQIALEENVPKVIPHIYSSIIDKKSGETKVEDVKELLRIIKKVVESFEQ